MDRDEVHEKYTQALRQQVERLDLACYVARAISPSAKIIRTTRGGKQLIVVDGIEIQVNGEIFVEVDLAWMESND